MHDPGDSRVNLFGYLAVVSRHRRLFIVFVIASMAVAAVVLMIMPQQYASSASLLPPDKAEGVSLTSIVQSTKKLDFAGLTENSSAEVLAKILGSRTVADSLVKEFDLIHEFDLDSSERELAIDAVLANLEITADRQGFVNVVYTVSTPWFAADEDQQHARTLSARIVNASIRYLDQMNRKKNVSRARRSREFLDVQRKRKRHELDSIQSLMEQFQRTNRAFAIDEQTKVSLDAMIALQAEINKIEILIASEETAFRSGPVLERLRSQLARLQMQKQQLEQGNIGESKAGFPLSGVPRLAREYFSLKLDLEIATQVYTFLETQYHQEAVQEARDLPTVSVLDQAVASQFRSAPRRKFALALAFAVALILGGVLVFVVDGISRQWRTLDPAQRSLLSARRSRKLHSAVGGTSE